MQSPGIRSPTNNNNKTMKKAMIYTRISGKLGLDHDGQRKEILARFGGEYEFVPDVGSGTQEIQDRPSLKKLVEMGDVEVLLCSDLTRLTRRLSPEILEAIQRAGVKIVTVDGKEMQ